MTAIQKIKTATSTNIKVRILIDHSGEYFQMNIMFLFFDIEEPRRHLERNFDIAQALYAGRTFKGITSSKILRFKKKKKLFYLN